MKSLPHVRKKEILEMLKRSDYIDAGELSRKFNVSYMTIHRDLKALEEEGMVSRVYGGAVAASGESGVSPVPPAPSADLTLEERFPICREEKMAIARAAVELVEPGDIICMDASTSALQMCPLLHDREVTVVTNSLNVAIQFADSRTVQVLLLGGLLRKSSMSLSRVKSPDLLEHINIGKCFFSASGLSSSKGMMELSYEESEAKREMLSRADKLYVLADHTKLGTAAPYVDCRCQRITAVITDWCPTMEESQRRCLGELDRAGIRIIYGKQES